MKDKPTLLQINVTANVGSHGRIAEAIGELVIEKEWRSIIAYGRDVKPSKSELIRIGTDFDIKEHVLESRLFDNHGLASRMATRKFIKKIEEIHPDIIHLHVIHGYYLNYKVLFEYLNSTKIPVVWTFHDTWAYTGHCGHYGLIGCNKWKTQCGACPLKWRDYPKSIIDRSRGNFELKRSIFTSNNNLHIVTVSQWLKHEVEQSFFEKNDIREISNGVDLGLFREIEEKNLVKEEKQYCSKFIILGVSAIWGPVKGLEDFIKLSEFLAPDELIILVGVSDEQKKILPHNIIGLPRTNGVEELVRLYNLADVTLSLSRAETFGLTIAESLACGTPAIVYNQTALPYLIDENTGFTVEVGDINGLYSAIQQIRRRGRLEYTLNCRNRAEKLYDLKKSYCDYIKLYEELLHE